MTDTDGLSGGRGPKPCTKGQLDDTYATSSDYAVSAAEHAHTIAAPGTCVLSDGLGGRLSTYDGTSQAAPHVALNGFLGDPWHQLAGKYFGYLVNASWY